MKMLCDGNIVSFVVAESLCDVTVTLSDLLGLKYTVVDPHFREPTVDIHHKMSAESLLHPQVVLGHARSMSATASFFISYLAIHPINDVRILDSKQHVVCVAINLPAEFA